MQPHPDEFFISLLVLLGLLAVLVQSYSKSVTTYFKSFMSLNRSLQMLRDENDLNKKVSWGIDVLSQLTVALFIVVILYRLGLDEFLLQSIYGSIIVYAIILSALSLFKKFIIWLISMVYHEHVLGNMHQLFFSLSIKAIATVVLPMLFLIIYGPNALTSMFIYVTLGLCGLIYLVLLGRILIVSFKSLSFPKYYSFLYLCALEIFPVLIAIRLLS